MKYLIITTLIITGILNNNISADHFTDISRSCEKEILPKIHNSITYYYSFASAKDEAELEQRFKIYQTARSIPKNLIEKCKDPQKANILIDYNNQILVVMKNTYIAKKHSFSSLHGNDKEEFMKFEKRIYHMIDIVRKFENNLNEKMG